MSKKIVLVNVEFKDARTGKKHIAGKTIELSDERIAEVKEVNPNFITVIGDAEPDQVEQELAKAKEEAEQAKAEAKAANAEIAKLKKELEAAKK